MENKNTILSDEELKDVAGGTSSSANPYPPATTAYCEGHYSETSCRNTNRCTWHPSNASEWGGWCLPKGS